MFKYGIVIYFFVFLIIPLYSYADINDLGCQYASDNVNVDELQESGVYHENITGMLCIDEYTEDEMLGKQLFRHFIPLKKGKIDGRVYSYYTFIREDDTNDEWYIDYYYDYKEGVKHGKHVEYSIFEGEIRFEANYKDGELDGTAREYDQDTGILFSKMQFKNGKTHGKSVTYYGDGNKEVTYYINDKKVEKLDDLDNNMLYELYNIDNNTAGK